TLREMSLDSFWGAAPEGLSGLCRHSIFRRACSWSAIVLGRRRPGEPWARTVPGRRGRALPRGGLDPVAIEGGAGQQHQRHRRRHGDEDEDQNLVQHRARLQDAEIDGRGQQHEGGPEAGAEGGGVHAFEEAAEPHQADGADQGDRRAGNDQQGDQYRRPFGECREPAHSITSPRIRNLARARVPTKLTTPITSAASKYTVLPVRMPNVTSTSMALR